MLKMYLAGAIRDKHPEDIAWREQLIDRLFWLTEAGQLQILNPLGGKRFQDGKWTISGVPSESQHIVTADFWSVDNADIMVVNLLSLSEGYPSIGTLTEWGRSTVGSKLRYVIAKPDYKGHQNLDMYSSIHPFIAQNMTHRFDTVESCIEFLAQHLPVISGANPWFGDRGSRDRANAKIKQLFGNA